LFNSKRQSSQTPNDRFTNNSIEEENPIHTCTTTAEQLRITDSTVEIPTDFMNSTHSEASPTSLPGTLPIEWKGQEEEDEETLQKTEESGESEDDNDDHPENNLEEGSVNDLGYDLGYGSGDDVYDDIDDMQDYEDDAEPIEITLEEFLKLRLKLL
jgi:hypothetical protein